MSKPLAYSIAQNFGPAPRQTFEVDRHYLLYAATGTMRLEAENISWSLPPARAALIAANNPVEVTLPVQITCRSVLFLPELVAPPEKVLSVFDVSPLARELIMECGQWGAEDDPLPDYASGLFKTLASVTWKLAQSPTELHMPMARSDVVRRVLDLTEAGLVERLTFEDVAKEVAVAPRSLARRISAELGMSWRQVLQRIRVIRAVEALSLSDQPITDIAFSQGYQSLSAFNSAFRELTGKSPSAYRASFKS
ncbi:MAG: AraC family transcriptional regulator [Roseibium sp.]